jgi:hypothetical protein
MNKKFGVLFPQFRVHEMTLIRVEVDILLSEIFWYWEISVDVSGEPYMKSIVLVCEVTRLSSNIWTLICEGRAWINYIFKDKARADYAGITNVCTLKERFLDDRGNCNLICSLAGNEVATKTVNCSVY